MAATTPLRRREREVMEALLVCSWLAQRDGGEVDG
jgi:hypothetical protein